MAPAMADPRMMSIHPRIRYNTIGGVNGPLVILENVSIGGLILGLHRLTDAANRSNFQGTTKLCHSRYRMDLKEQDRFWKLEVCITRGQLSEDFIC